MNFYLFLLIILVAGAILVLGKLSVARKRQYVLAQKGRVSTWEDIKIQSDKFNKIVQTNFGYGGEVWVFTKESTEVDLKLRAFKAGVLIVPKPKTSDLKQFCQSRGIAFDLIMVK